MTCTERATLAPFDQECLRQKAVKPLTPLFDTKGELTKQDNQSMDFLTNSLDFQKQVKNLKTWLISYSMIDVFDLYKIDAISGLPTSTTDVNLLEEYSNVTLAQVMDNSKMHFGYGDKVTGENLLWSKALILASCDPDLKTKIETQMASLAPHHNTGLFAFF